MSYKKITCCRVCGNEDLTTYLDLGMMPLSNNLCQTKDEQPERYPLQVVFCNGCALSQLSIVVDPQVMFSNYVYHSGIAKGYRDHCAEMAVDLKEKYNLTKDSFHIDIAGNDGTLLKEFKKLISYDKCLNVDPAVNMVTANEEEGVRMFTTFWGMAAAQHLHRTEWPKADLITATNVFAHVDNVKEFIEAAKLAMKSTGVLILEFPYLPELIEHLEFDTVYHEHLSYFLIRPLVMLCNECGLAVLDAEKIDIHGGSVRVTIGNAVPADSVNAFIEQESNNCFYKLSTYKDWADEVSYIIKRFRDNLIKLKDENNVIAGFAASAKGNTLLNCAGIDSNTVSYIIDQTPEKICKFSPGTGIPIVSLFQLAVDMPDYIVLLSWNFAAECMQKCKDAGYDGKFILPLTFEIL